MAKRRYKAPARESVAASVFQHPIFVPFEAQHAWLNASTWPSIESLGEAARDLRHQVTGRHLHFIAQNEALLADGLHYEQRIFERGQIATRESNWHDLFNALIWLQFPALKSAVNARYVQDLTSRADPPPRVASSADAHSGDGTRSRAQQAITHFDEAGAVVLIRDRELLKVWDQHDWLDLFHHHRPSWASAMDAHGASKIEFSLFGHALLEHQLDPHQTMVAKCLVLLDESGSLSLQQANQCVAAAILDGRALRDPQELRPLPLLGIPGWFDRPDFASFVQSAPCFRPLRPGKRYPAALMP